MNARFRLDGVVTTVDAVLGEQQLDSYFEAVKQVAVADILLLTKSDLASADATSALKIRLIELNPAAEIVPVTHGVLDPALIQNLGLWNAETKSIEVTRWLKAQRYKPATRGALGAAPAPQSDGHDLRIHAFSVVIDEPIDRFGLQSALQMLTSFRSEYLLRFKAIVNLQSEPLPVVLHGVQHVLYRKSRWTPGRTPIIAAGLCSSCAIWNPRLSRSCWTTLRTRRAALWHRHNRPAA